MANDSSDSKRRLVKKIFALLLVGVVLTFGGVVLSQRKLVGLVIDNWDVIAAGSEWSTSAENVDAFLEYLAAHPERVSIATWPVGEPDKGFFHNADTPRPLASTVKLLVLTEYARQVSDGRLNPDERIPMARWEALQLPGTDGGAHEVVLKELRDRKLIVEEQVPLSAVVRAMVVFSDNAATDLVMLRLGREALEKVPELLGVPGQEAPWPLNGGLLVAMSAPPEKTTMEWISEVNGHGRAWLRDEAWRLSRQLVDDAAFSEGWRSRLKEEGLPLDVRAQRAVATHLVPRGTARGYARLMEHVLTAPADAAWAPVMSKPLEWPLEKGEALSERFARLGTKGGSLAGVLTSAWYAQTTDGRSRVLAAFHDEMPIALWAQLLQKFTQQELERQILEVPGFVDEVRRRIEAGPTPDAGTP
jgi:D-alanyl-D-alanine carboxypeptidase